jgi:hypothetical protein
VRIVEGAITQPRRRWIVVIEHPRHDNAVLVSAPRPLVDHGLHVVEQVRHVTIPHSNGRMIAPARTGNGERCHDLLALHALFPKPLPVEALGRAREVRVWQECLHHFILRME